MVTKSNRHLRSMQKTVSFGGLFLLKQILHNPLIIASFIGISWSYLGLSIPEVMDRSLI